MLFRVVDVESAPEPEVTETFATDEQAIAASQTGFRVALTRRDRELGRLRLSREAADALASSDVDIAIRHDETRDRYSGERDGAALYGIRYPLALHPASSSAATSRRRLRARDGSEGARTS